MEFISDQERADELLNKWVTSDCDRAFYLDFEADNYHHYEEVLCTVQVCYSGKFYLLDAINLDLTTHFTELLKTKPLWLHGCDYDLYLLNRFLKMKPVHLRDTQVAARLCGFRKFGYASLVKQICGVDLPKDSQRADWTKRPLPEKMVKYAENDVRYLPQISDLLEERLEKLGRASWFEESCKALIENSTRSASADQTERWRFSGTGPLHPRELNYVYELYQWRDLEAKNADTPPFKVMNNQMLLDSAKKLAQGEQMKISKGMREKRRNALLAAIEIAHDKPQEEWPEKAKRVRGSRVRIDEEKLKKMLAKRESVAQQLNIEASCIASRKVLEAILKDPEEVTSLLNWQRELLEL